MSWPGARKVLAPVGAVVTLGDPADAGDPADVGDPAGVLAELAAVELLDELQADTSKAVHASTAPAVTCRALPEFAVNMKFPPLSFP